MIQCKAKPDPKRKQDNNDRNNHDDWGGRGDTWTDPGQPLYDRHGNQVGTYNPPNYDDGRG